MKDEDVTELFNKRVCPAFKNAYPNMVDTFFFIDDSPDIDGAGGVGIVGVTTGACKQADFLVKFAIAHETAHGVVALEHINQHTNCPQAMGADRKKHEAWADLIATKVLITQLPDLWASIEANLPVIANILGGATPSHPSGARRVALIREFAAAYNRAGSRSFFSRIFCCCTRNPTNTIQARADAFDAAFERINTAHL